MKKFMSLFLVGAALVTAAPFTAQAEDYVGNEEALVDTFDGEELDGEAARYHCTARYTRRTGEVLRFHGESRHLGRAMERAMNQCRAQVRHPHWCMQGRCRHH